jgi:hypothetical protein
MTIGEASDYTATTDPLVLPLPKPKARWPTQGCDGDRFLNLPATRLRLKSFVNTA